jgi:hypothetical protein
MRPNPVSTIGLATHKLTHSQGLKEGTQGRHQCTLKPQSLIHSQGLQCGGDNQSLST